MKAYTNETMRQMDACAIQKYQIPSLVLMEHAAMAIATYLHKHVEKTKAILIVCGPGNNGGDGFCLARILYSLNYEKVSVYCCVDEDKMSKDEKQNAMILKHYPIPWYQTTNEEALKQLFSTQDYFIDALFGTGLDREINGFYKRFIELMMEANKFIYSVDMPSGIHGNNGSVLGCAVQANKTLTFEGYKLGQLLYPGSAYCGDIEVLSIMMPKAIVDKSKGITILDKDMIHLPKRINHSHKGSYGKALLIGGSRNMHGAITMCAKACLRSGIGTLTLFVPDCIHDLLASKLEESMLISAPSEDGFFAEDAYLALANIIDDYDMLVIGNGMGRSKSTLNLVECVLKSNKPCILDGDALFELGKITSCLHREALTIITPHMKEMSYITNRHLQDIMNHKVECAKELVKTYPNCCLVLKDEHSIIAYQDEIYMNLAGNHSLAKGGSGDVLCGMIAGLYGQAKDCVKACIDGVYLHAYCADELVKKMDANSILASDIIAYLANAYQAFR